MEICNHGDMKRVRPLCVMIQTITGMDGNVSHQMHVRNGEEPLLVEYLHPHSISRSLLPRSTLSSNLPHCRAMNKVPTHKAHTKLCLLSLERGRFLEIGLLLTVECDECRRWCTAE